MHQYPELVEGWGLHPTARFSKFSILSYKCFQSFFLYTLFT
jgi:hypothetical protein